MGWIKVTGHYHNYMGKKTLDLDLGKFSILSGPGMLELREAGSSQNWGNPSAMAWGKAQGLELIWVELL
jgi:hypothetical protein